MKMKPKIKKRPSKLRRGVVLPTMVSLVSQGAAIKKPRVMRARQTFWAVRFCTVIV